MTVAEFREWLLDTQTTPDMIRRASRGLTSEIVAGVCKLMSNLDLIYAAKKMRVTAHLRVLVGKASDSFFSNGSNRSSFTLPSSSLARPISCISSSASSCVPRLSGKYSAYFLPQLKSFPIDKSIISIFFFPFYQKSWS